MAIKIDKGIPIPARSRVSAGARRKYPWPDMKVGDSFWISAEGRNLDQMQQLILTVAKMWALRNFKPWMFTTARERSAKSVPGVRIWRIM